MKRKRIYRPLIFKKSQLQNDARDRIETMIMREKIESVFPDKVERMNYINSAINLLGEEDEIKKLRKDIRCLEQY